MSDIEIRVNSVDNSRLDTVTTKAKNAGREIGAGLGKGFADAKKSSEEASKKIGEDFEKTKKSTEDTAKKMDAAFSSAAKEIKSDFERIERDAWKSGRAMDESFMKTVREAKESFDIIEREAAKTGKGLDSDLGRALLNVRNDLDKTAKAAKQAGNEIEEALTPDSNGGGFSDMLGEGLSGGLSGMMDGIMSKAGPMGAAGLALGTALGQAAIKGAESVFQRNEIGGLISAQNAGTIAAGKRMGEIAGDAYYDGFGESMEDSGVSLSAIVGNSLADMSGPAESLEKLTKMASVAADVVGEEAGQIGRAAKQLIVNDLAPNAESAIDLIVTASQRGVNVSGDMIDTIIEYGTKFRDLGLTGEQSLGLISQALQAGARDSDTAADALKELNIRASDGTAARGFEAIGLSAENMRNAFSAGGDAANDALRKTLNGLQAIEDPTLRNQAAIDLFGTKAEDLGDALYAMDLDTVSKQMGKVEGATDSAARTMIATQDPVDRLDRSWSHLLDTIAGDGLDVLDKALAPTLIKGAGATRDLSGATDEAAEATDGAADSASNYARSLDEVIAAGEEAANIQLGLSGAQINYADAIRQANEGLVDNKKNLDINTKAGSDNFKNLNDIADSAWRVVEGMQAQNATQQEVHDFMVKSRGAFVQMATDMGMDAQEAENLATKLGLVAGDYVAEVKVVGSDLAKQKARELLDELSRLPPQKVVNLRVTTSATGMGGHYFADAHGGIVAQQPWGAATGGQRHSSTVINEGGPELVELPNGARVATAGAARAMGEAGWLGGGGGGEMVWRVETAGAPMDELLAELIRKYVKPRGGNVQQVFGGRN